MNLYDLIEDLQGTDGIEDVAVEVEVTATVRKQNTGEVDDSFNELRERVVSEEELAGLIEGTDWSYSGTVDVVGDFHLRDRFRRYYRLEADDE